MSNNLVNILGINVSTLNQSEIKTKIDDFLNGDKAKSITTVNPEIILQAMKDEEYFVILGKADLSIPDGIGVKFAAWALYKNVYRFSGINLVEYLLTKAAKKNIKVAVLLWKDGLTKSVELENVLKNKYSNLQFICQDVGREIDKFSSEKIDSFQPQIVFVALGAPWQEKFIYHQILNKPYVKIGIGVGGSFDFISGKIIRAPKIIQNLGLEWIYRIFMQPKGRKVWRLQRIYNAFIVFTSEYLRWRFILPCCYRPNVACMLYKKENGKYKILLVKRSDWEEAHWQLPQGGRDGMNPELAGLRELSEELNTNKLKAIASFKDLYKYSFLERGGKTSYAIACQKHTGYKGQVQSLLIAEFLGKDEDIKVNYWDHNDWKWIDSDKLLEEVYPTRRDGYKIYLEKFKEIIK